MDSLKYSFENPFVLLLLFRNLSRDSILDCCGDSQWMSPRFFSKDSSRKVLHDFLPLFLNTFYRKFHQNFSLDNHFCMSYDFGDFYKKHPQMFVRLFLHIFLQRFLKKYVHGFSRSSPKNFSRNFLKIPSAVSQGVFCGIHPWTQKTPGLRFLEIFLVILQEVLQKFQKQFYLFFVNSFRNLF